MQENKVISSKITRDYKPLKNNLYDLVKVKPATPTSLSIPKEHNCDFQPVTGKIFTPKKRIRLMKVKTVRDIRNLYESDIYIDLPKDLEKQQNVLLKKITCGSSREENTKAIARNMLKYDKPVSRTSWQMIMNVNPDGQPHAIQYVLWNGKRIRINGSKGGKNKFLCNYDLSNIKIPIKKETKHKTCLINKGLLRNSLTVKFKPGPLTRKKSLDDSFQKYNVGKTELLNLPKPGLHIQSLYGVALEPMIANFVQNLQDNDGTISEKWAEFAVSVLGTVKNTEPVQNDNQSGVTFGLNYKRDQRRILLRRDIDNASTVIPKSFYAVDASTQISNETELSDIQNILKEMINSVEISLQQDYLYTGEDEPRESTYEETVNIHIANKEKGNKKRFCELDRLDVTVIRLPDVDEDDTSKTCRNAHCSLGCICASLQRSYNIRQHCGRLECMFDCHCDFTKYKVTDTFDSDCSELIPGLINLDNKLNSKLAKEEQKFHQTVVLSGEKSILLKSEKRNWKASKRYGNFYESMCLKNYVNGPRVLSIVDVKLNCENVEPWCMVHNLYKCFCKGKFTQQNIPNTIDEIEVNETTSHDSEMTVIKNGLDKDKKSHRLERKTSDRNTNIYPVFDINQIIDLDSTDHSNCTTCARSRPYKGRKYYDSYYFNANKRIIEMEKNDDHLRKRMLAILQNKTEDSDSSNQISYSTSQSSDNILQVQDTIENNHEKCLFENTNKANQTLSSSERSNCNSPLLQSMDNITPDRSILNTSTNKTKLIAWLESSYKQYKQRIEQGIVKKSLDPPKHGKVALYPWEFILTRYRERKNLFLISQQKPFRIFMAVDAKNSFFENCVNIDSIRFADLHKYPVTVKNLLTNATDLKDNFCILCGLAICWELIGSVTKVDNQTNDTDELQSVADDKKIGFVAQDNKNVFSNEKSANNDDREINILANEGHTESIKNLVDYIEKKDDVQLKGKKHKPNIRKLRYAGRFTKTRSATNYNVQNETTNLQSQKSCDSEEESEMTDANIIYSTTDDQDLEKVKESIDINKRYDELSTNTNPQDMEIQEQPGTDREAESSLQSSKWFVMTVENDFSEIKFFNRGFFVKYESIIKAINVARMSGKTVRLSKSKESIQTNCPQFGLYAIPNSNDFYVFIGPYDKNEPLGIETVKSFTNIRKKGNRTRGVWITTKKVDNIKVIDNPLSFMPIDLHTSNKIVSLENEVTSQPTDNDEPRSSNYLNDSEKTVPEQPLKLQAKVVKPIKIRKTSGFYQLAPQGFLTQVLPKPIENASHSVTSNLLQPILLKNFQSENNTVGMPVLQLPLPKLYSNIKQKPQSLLKTLVSDNRPQSSKPVAEIAPQIKIVDVYSESATRGNSQNEGNKSEGGMFILKPEEINKRLMENKVASNSQQSSTKGSDLDQDIENFLATSVAYVPPNADIFEISDEDDDPNTGSINWRNVWIECESAHLGCIKGKRNEENMLSFEFPGFKFTDFYPEEEAFSKINQVLSRKIYVPKSINLTWRVVESPTELKRKFELNETCLGTDFVLTKNGIRHKALIVGNKSVLKTSADDASSGMTSSAADSKLTVEEVDDAIEIINELEEQSNVLEEEGQKLITEMSKIDKSALLGSLTQVQDEPHRSAEQREQLYRENSMRKIQDLYESDR